MSPRWLIWSFVAAAAALGVWWLAEPSSVEPAQTARPAATFQSSPFRCEDCNVILISIDTLRADHMGVYGYERATTANIDLLANESLVFENAIAQSSWTTPSHASMLTGLAPSEHGLVVYPKPGRLAPGTRTIASLLRARGYQTASFNGGGYLSRDFGLDEGFDVYESPSRSFEATIGAAKAWLDERTGEPVFLFLHGYDVHRPYQHVKYNSFHEPEKPYDYMNFCNYESRVRKGDELAFIIAQYDAGIVHADRLLGRFFAYLEETGAMDKSIVIITSDHGEEFFEHGKCDHIHSVHRELIHVPMIVRLPSGIAARIEGQVAAGMGVLPTIASILGLDALEGVDFAYDMIPVARDSSRLHDPVVSETGAFFGGERSGDLKYHRKSVSAPTWKLIYDMTSGEQGWALYDVVADPGEQRDVFADNSEVVAKLKPMLFPEGQPSAPAVGRNTAPIDPDTVQQLEALGYVDPNAP